MAKANSNLTTAKSAKNDEFYTQYGEIQKEIEAYLEYDPDSFRNKTVYCNADDPYESNFFRYFVLNFNKLGLKSLITTSYRPSPIANTQLGLFGNDKKLESKKGRPKVTANKFIINEVGDIDGDGQFNLKDVALQLKTNKNNEWTPIDGDGDFRSDECIELLKQSDIVVTNPPFSLFREYVKQLFDYQKKFVIIGNMNAITYKEIFPLLKDSKMWLGAGKNDGRNVWYQVPDYYEKYHKMEDGKKYAFVAGTIWFTNLDHGRLHRHLPLMTEEEIVKFGTKKPFEKYDNYDAIEVPLVKYIPDDYPGTMGVPISFLSKHSPEQFEIIGITKTWFGLANKTYPEQTQVSKNGKKSKVTKLNDGATLKMNIPPENETYYIVDGEIYKQLYARVLIRHKQSKK
jgi:hypothetical protein